MATAKLPLRGVLATALDMIVQIDHERAIETNRVLLKYIDLPRFLSLPSIYDTYREALEKLRHNWYMRHKLELIENMWQPQRDHCEKIADLCRKSIRVEDAAAFIELTQEDLSQLGLNGRSPLTKTFEFARELKKEKEKDTE